jgi:hypothetical protein
LEVQPELNDEGVGDPKEVRKRRKKAKLEQERDIEELRQLLAVPGNRAFLWRLLDYCKVYHSNPFPENPGSMAMFEGRRMVGIWLLQEMHAADPLAYPRMRDEATEKQKRLTTPQA